jgi:tetratricopeptide (TPR) repeat protein
MTVAATKTKAEQALSQSFEAIAGKLPGGRAIAEARKADPSDAETYTAEGQLLEREGKRDEAVAAYRTAIEHGSQNAYAYYRFGVLSWGRDPDRDTLASIENALARAIDLNNRFASAYAALAEARAALHAEPDAAVSLVKRAIALEPSEPQHHLSAARIFWRLTRFDDARKEAQTAAALAQAPDDRDEAQRILTSIPK